MHIHAYRDIYSHIHAYTSVVPYTIRVLVVGNGTSWTVCTPSQSLWPMSTAEKSWRGASTSGMVSSLFRTAWKPSVRRWRCEPSEGGRRRSAIQSG